MASVGTASLDATAASLTCLDASQAKEGSPGSVGPAPLEACGITVHPHLVISCLRMGPNSRCEPHASTSDFDSCSWLPWNEGHPPISSRGLPSQSYDRSYQARI